MPNNCYHSTVLTVSEARTVEKLLSKKIVPTLKLCQVWYDPNGVPERYEPLENTGLRPCHYEPGMDDDQLALVSINHPLLENEAPYGYWFTQHCNLLGADRYLINWSI